MILYQSTRGGSKRFEFSEVIIKGIADDGGLFVPDKIPQIRLDDLKFLLQTTYQEKALFVFNLFETGFNKGLLKKFINKAYSSNFDHPQITPLVHLQDNQYVLELWHGPTSAFKDMALQFMPLLFTQAVKLDNQKRKKKRQKPLKYLILVATSGDTGKAALEGYKDKDGISIMVYYPSGGISKLQELSMITQEGNNIAVFDMAGNFDDIQRSVKETFNDREFNQLLKNKYDVILSSANSINWGRLPPQIVYQLSSYLELVNQKIIKIGDVIDIAIPTGNFGNILAAFYAKKMGLPIRKLICASNANNVLTEALHTGIYDVSKRKLFKTPSPAIDIIIASNFERLLYELTKDSRKISLWMKQLERERRFVIDVNTLKIIKNEFYADWVSNEDCLKTIKKVFDDTGYLLDPHTAVAQAVVSRYRKKYPSDIPIIISSTAHWAKFPKDVYRALTGIFSDDDEFKIIDKIRQLIPTATIPERIGELRRKKIRHTGKCNIGKDEIERIILNTI